MLSIRNAYTDVFARGDRKTIVASDEKGYDIVSRSYKGTKLYVGLNIKDVAQTVEIPVSENNGTVLKDLYFAKTFVILPIGVGTNIAVSESRAKSGRKSEGFSETLDFRRESALDV